MNSAQPEAPQARQQSLLILLGELVLPNASELLAASAKRVGDKPVAGLIAGDLLGPEPRVLPRLGRVDRAPVPEAAVNEDGDAEFGENEVGSAEARMISPPACDAGPVQDRDQAELVVLVAVAANARYGGGAFRFRDGS